MSPDRDIERQFCGRPMLSTERSVVARELGLRAHGHCHDEEKGL